MIISALHRKLFRDLYQMKGQALAIALVIASGMATFIMSLTTIHTLEQSMSGYYQRQRFAQVFARLKRAPRHVVEQVAAIDGVAGAQGRVVVEVNLHVPGMIEAATGRIISIPEEGQPDMNRLYLRAGRWVEPGRAGEVIASEAFTRAHGLRPGDRVAAVINGTLEQLRIVGIALSPEYIYQIKPGDILPDPLRFGVFWMSQRQLAPAFDMDGAVNDLCVTLTRDAVEQEVIDRIDALTDRYGSLGAFGRDDQPSHEFVSNEIRELRGMATVVPAIFLLVAAFLLNVVLSRLVSTQREQIATLKAFGYSNLEVGWHYFQMVLSVVLVGAVIGTVMGSWMGRQIAMMYAKFFHFPSFEFALEPWVVILGVVVSAAAGFLGTMSSVRRAATLPPAQAMRPEPPATFRPTTIERLGLQRLAPPAARMILRELERRPFKAAISCLGMAMAVAVLVVGSFMKDAIDYIIDLQFNRSQRQAITVTLTDPAAASAAAEFAHLPAVRAVEPFRAVAVRLRHGHRSRRVGITGLVDDRTLFRIVDLEGRVIDFSSDGLYLSAKLGEVLGVGAGDRVTVEVLEDRRPVLQLPVAGLVDDFSGTSAYMRLDALHRLMREQDRISGAHLGVDPVGLDALHRELKEIPAIGGVGLKSAVAESFRNTVAENLMRMRMFNVMFAVIIAFGVVYNSARISFAERSRELATLRVIGFTRAEVSMILLGELAILTALAIPVGLALGYTFAALVTWAIESELFRIPLVVNRPTFGFASVVVMAAAIVSALIVRRRIDHLDLIGVLKTRE